MNRYEMIGRLECYCQSMNRESDCEGCLLDKNKDGRCFAFSFDELSLDELKSCLHKINEAEAKEIEEAEESEEEKPVDLFERAYGQDYWTINGRFEVCLQYESFRELDNLLFSSGSYYPLKHFTKEQVQQFAWRDQIHALLRRFTLQNGWNDDLWDDCQSEKWYIVKDSHNKYFYGQNSYTAKSNDVFFLSEEIALHAIDEVVNPFMAEHQEFVW